MLEDVKTTPGAWISCSANRLDGVLHGHRCVVAELHGRLEAGSGNDPPASYIRADRMRPDVQKKIHATLEADSFQCAMANDALSTSWYVGLEPGCRLRPPPIENIASSVLPWAIASSSMLENWPGLQQPSLLPPLRKNREIQPNGTTHLSGPQCSVSLRDMCFIRAH